MKRTQLVTLILINSMALAGTSGLAAAEEAQPQETQPIAEQLDLREEIASPLAGEFTPSGDAFRSGGQQDFGGLSGNANGMDSFPTASGEPSAYPDNNTANNLNNAPDNTSNNTSSNTSGNQF